MADARVVTRFAPSPTGFLHIGGARTALFNWLFARHHGGQFLLRIEDTDRKRSTDEAIDAIFEGMDWLGLQADQKPVRQFAQADRHAEVARQLLENGGAYHCYASPEELAEMRAAQKAAGKPMRYDGRWRDRNPSEAPEGVDPVVRLRAPQSGATVVHDQVQGNVTFQNEQLDDMILLRADGTPTYMLSVVVDDHDMGVTHVIRGDDHLVNAARQTLLFQAMGWDVPTFAHIPLIHGPDGAKLSKRHGALGVEAYRDMGYLPDAMRNYLVRLGWSHGDDEIFSTEQAIKWFDLAGIGRSASRFDFDKLANLNGLYIRNADVQSLIGPVTDILQQSEGVILDSAGTQRLEILMPGLQERAKTLVELADASKFLFASRPLTPNAKAEKLLKGDGRSIVADLADALDGIQDWAADKLENEVKAFAESRELKLGKVAQPLRAALTGSNVSPGIYDVLIALGREESVARMRDVKLTA